MLIAVASVGVFLLLMFCWFAVSLIFGWRFQYSIRSLMLLVVAVALPFSWLGVEMKAAREQRAAVEAIRKLGGYVNYEYAGQPLQSPQPALRAWLSETPRS